MIIFVRRSAATVVLGAALVGCGSGVGESRGSLATQPSASASASASGRPVPVPSPERAAPPTLAAGPGGLTPVFERALDTRTKTVALTFDADMTADQGPRAAGGEHFDNPALIASLRRLKVPATVFMTGRWAEEYPDQARSIGRDPLFEIANHSYSHHAFTSPCYGLPTVSGQQMRTDVERAFAAFRKAGARNIVPYFRFPGGCYDDGPCAHWPRRR